MIDVTKLRKGVKVRTNPGVLGEKGTVLVVRNSYMSATGLMIVAKEGNNLCDHNIPIEALLEVVNV